MSSGGMTVGASKTYVEGIGTGILKALAFVLVVSLLTAAQSLLATIPVGAYPVAVAENSTTNKIYVINQQSNNMTVLDGWTNNPVTVMVGGYPAAIAINPATNRIYVANDNDNTVSVVNGSNNFTTTVNVGNSPDAIAVNAVTNKIYVANFYSNDVTVIDGATNLTVKVGTGRRPFALAIDSATNKIYVANSGSNDVTIIDGASNSTTSVTAGSYPWALAVNSITNTIYVVNYGSHNVSVIDGVTNSVTSVAVGTYPSALAVDPVHNRVYVANNGDGSASIIDGAPLAAKTVPIGSSPNAVDVNPATNQAYFTNMQWNGTVTALNGANDSTATVTIGIYPVAIAVNPLTNRVYAVNNEGAGEGSVSVLAGASPAALQFVPVVPCRVVDTRSWPGPFGGPYLASGEARSFAIPQGNCSIPSTAVAYSLNVTLAPLAGGPLGFLTIWPTGEGQPLVSTLNSPDGRVKANAAIVPAGASGAVSVFVSDATDVLLDIDGYFQPPTGGSLQFYPIVACRALDTRRPNGELGGPYLQGTIPRNFPVLSSNCQIPPSALAYSINFTVVPVGGNPLGYLTVWAAGQDQPIVSTLNNPTATVVANAAIVPAGSGGAIAVYAYNDTDLIGDINGYFAAPGPEGMSLYSIFPCRVIDTRGSGGPFSGQRNPPVDVAASMCGVPSAVQSYVMNATVVPAGSLGYLTLWADGEWMPIVSTLNAQDGTLTSNMAIMGNLDGKINAYAYGVTQLILDISSYFAP